MPGCKINYWDCEFCNYDEDYDGEEEFRYYFCSNDKNETGYCEHENKFHDRKAFCKLAKPKPKTRNL